MTIGNKRLQQGMFEALASQNRFAGSGGGSGMQALAPAGFAAVGNQGAYSTANNSTWTDISNSSFTVVVNRPALFLYDIYIAAHLSAAGALGYIRGNIVGFDTSAAILFGSTSTISSAGRYFPFSKGPIQPGVYTVKLQAATDNNTFTITVDGLFHMVLLISQ